MDINMDINDDNNDYFISSNKEDVETGIFRRKNSYLNNNNNDEKTKKDLIKQSDNYIIFLYIFIAVILFILLIRTIFNEDEKEDNFKKLIYLKNKLNDNNLQLNFFENEYKNDELEYKNEHFYYTHKTE